MQFAKADRMSAKWRDRLTRWRNLNGFPSGRAWWEVDHIVPVVLGGGCCGLDNLRTLCVPCHKKATARLAAERARARREAKLLAKHAA